MSSRYNFRDRTKSVRDETESKRNEVSPRKRPAPKTKESTRPSKRIKIVKQQMEKIEGVEQIEEVKQIEVRKIEVKQIEVKESEQHNSSLVKEEPPRPLVKIPGLTLLEGGKTDLTENTYLSQAAASKFGQEDPVQTFDASVTAFLSSIDSCREAEIETATVKRHLRTTAKVQRGIEEAFEQALAAQGSSAKEFDAATESLELGKYFLNVYAEAKLPPMSPMRLGIRNFFPALSTESDSPIDEFPWVELDWSVGKESLDAETPVISPHSTPHTVSIYLLPDLYSSERIQVYSRTFDHRIGSCPHPSLCPLCKFRGREGFIAPIEDQGRLAQVNRSSQLAQEATSTSGKELESDMTSSSGKKVEIETTSSLVTGLITPKITASAPKELSTIEEEPEIEDDDSSLKLPSLLKRSQMVEVTLLHLNRHQIGESRRVETHQCESFDGFKERIGVAFADVIEGAGLPFDRTIYDQFTLFNRGTSILETHEGESSRAIWKTFMELLERDWKREQVGGVIGCVEIIFE